MNFLSLFQLVTALNSNGSQAVLKDIAQVDKPSVTLPAPSFAYQRSQMVKDQLETRGIKDPRVLAAMNTIPRHLFVPEKIQSQAYEDSAQPIGLGQTISQPYIVALMSEAARVSPQDKVLEIGTATGYQAAIMSQLAKEVYTIEIVAPLALSAQKRLASFGYNNVHVKIGDGNLGWQDHAPFDVILVTAQASEIPKPLLTQLNENGRLIMPVGDPEHQNLLRITKKEGSFKVDNLGGVRFVPLIKGLPKTPE